jgi:hypothetical protein
MLELHLTCDLEDLLRTTDVCIDDGKPVNDASGSKANIQLATSAVRTFYLLAMPVPLLSTQEE